MEFSGNAVFYRGNRPPMTCTVEIRRLFSCREVFAQSIVSWGIIVVIFSCVCVCKCARGFYVDFVVFSYSSSRSCEKMTNLKLFFWGNFYYCYFFFHLLHLLVWKLLLLCCLYCCIIDELRCSIDLKKNVWNECERMCEVMNFLRNYYHNYYYFFFCCRYSTRISYAKCIN